ncbi:uncharacterized protein [Diabrotica undecimpunctata]|uniref:uncharacterized protein n=1 Tax=Diabrotica undecimpunctata TaxID=50387 RepID=UPI003B639E09
MAGWKWVRGFLKLNPRLSLRTPENTSLARAQAFNKPNICAYFTALAHILDEFQFPPENIYNIDESGLTTVQKRSQKIYASKGRKQVGALSSAERGLHITVVCAMNAIGTYVPPALIFPRQRKKDELMIDAPTGSVAFAQEKGWMTSDMFCLWLQHFLRYSKASKTNQVLLLLDGHGSHKSFEALQFAKENGIIMFCFPAHCSHHVQPLDVGFFRPLQTYYGQEIQLWLRQNPGKTVTQFKVASIFNNAHLKSALPSIAINAFKKTGIEPFNPDAFEDWQFLPSITTDRENYEQNPLPGCSDENSLPEHRNQNVSVIECVTQKRGRKRGKTGYLNSTPEIDDINQKIAEKEAKKKKKRRKKSKKASSCFNYKQF